MMVHFRLIFTVFRSLLEGSRFLARQDQADSLQQVRRSLIGNVGRLLGFEPSSVRVVTGLLGGQRGRGQRVTVRQSPEPGGRGRRLMAMMDIAIRAAGGPGRHRLVYLYAALAGVAAGLVIGLAARVPGRIPADARVVTVTPVFDFGHAPGRGEPDRAFTVTDPATVAQIAAVIDGLRQLDGTYSCPAEADSGLMLTSMQLTFRTAPGGPVAATAGAGYTGCQFAWVAVGAQTVWQLDANISSGQTMQQRVLAIAGVRWPYPPG
jgi:hypothetical protein